jgi:hypothetical protein
VWRHYRKLTRGEFIVVGVDTAAGGGDYCAAQFLSKTKLDVPFLYHNQTLASEMTPELHMMLEAVYETTGVRPVVAYERQNGGVFEMERLAALNKRGDYIIYQAQSNVGTVSGAMGGPKLGWDTNTATRPTMLADLKDCIDNKLLTIYDKQTVNEMFAFVVVRTTSAWKAQAENGSHDDLVMSLAIAWQLYQSESPDDIQQSSVVYAKPPHQLQQTPYIGQADNTTSITGIDLTKVVKDTRNREAWKYNP